MEQLLPNLCEYLNGLGEGEEMRRESLLVYITVIPKEGNYATLCSSYRPIALLNADTKFAKVIATRLKKLMSEWIHEDQTGFIPGRESKDNSIRTLLLLRKKSSWESPFLLLSIDAEKAFDKVDWGFITIENLGLGPKMI